MSANLSGNFSDSSLPDSDLKTEEISPSSLGAASVVAARHCTSGRAVRAQRALAAAIVDVRSIVMRSKSVMILRRSVV